VSFHPAKSEKRTCSDGSKGCDLFALAQPEWKIVQVVRNLDRERVSTAKCCRSERLDWLLVAFGDELGKVKAEEPRLSGEERQGRRKSRVLEDQWTKGRNAS
jgi:hypothetical protein